MSIKNVRAHKMYEKFHISPPLIYVGEYNIFNNLVNVYNSSNQKLSRITGTYQWVLIDKNCDSSDQDVFFIEEHPVY